MSYATTPTDSDYEKRGRWFQIRMMFAWVLLALYSFPFDWSKPFEFNIKMDWKSAFVIIGNGLILFSMMQIYRGKNRRRLVTSNVFAITRHPMYHGMFIAACATLFVADTSDPIYWLIWLVFLTLLFTAGWFQEQETVARWGDEAFFYYDRTPRFVVEWLWYWLR